MTKVETISDQSKKIFHEVIAAISPEQSKNIKICLYSYFLPVWGVQDSAPAKQIMHLSETLGLSLMIKDSLAAVASFYLVPKYIKTDSYRGEQWSFFGSDGFFPREPLASMVFQWFCSPLTITINYFFNN